MVNRLTVSFLVLLFLVHLYVNIRLSADIVGWVPDARKRNALLALVWLLPLVGALYVYRRLALSWFTPESGGSDSQSVVGAGLLGLDAIFNPGARHIAEAHKKGEITIKAEGEMYDRELPEFIDVEAMNSQMKDAGDKAE